MHHSANAAVIGALSFAYRVFVDGFQHAIWAGVAAFFIGIAVNYPRRRVPLILFGVTIAAVLHALNDWYLSNFILALAVDRAPGVLAPAVPRVHDVGRLDRAAGTAHPAVPWRVHDHG